MQAKELRIGNLLKRADDSIFTVDGNDIKLISEWKNPFAPLPSPIPLTEEWLLKFGFEIVKSEKSRYVGEKVYWHPSTRTFAVDSNNGDLLAWPDMEVRRIFFVHQLQNIYFALTGQELA